MKNLIIILLWSINVLNIYGQQRSWADYLPPNYVRDGSVDYTIHIQKYLDENLHVLFPNFPILVNDKGLYLRSHQEIVFQKNSKLVLKPSSKGKYALIHIHGVKGVVIRNIQLEGDRYIHMGKTGEWGMGIDIRNSQNITIYNPHISKFWGDGVYIAGKETDKVLIQGGTLKENRRNGVSIVSGNNIHLKNIVIEETKGTWPMSAIDIEPNSSENDYLGKIFIENITSRNNPRGISIVLSNYLSEKSNLIDIKILDFISTGDEIAIKINPFVNKKINNRKVASMRGEVEFKNVQITRSKRNILIQGNSDDYSFAPTFVFRNISMDASVNLVSQFGKFEGNKFHLFNEY